MKAYTLIALVLVLVACDSPIGPSAMVPSDWRAIACPVEISGPCYEDSTGTRWHPADGIDPDGDGWDAYCEEC